MAERVPVKKFRVTIDREPYYLFMDTDSRRLVFINDRNAKNVATAQNYFGLAGVLVAAGTSKLRNKQAASFDEMIAKDKKSFAVPFDTITNLSSEVKKMLLGSSVIVFLNCQNDRKIRFAVTTKVGPEVITEIHSVIGNKQ